MLPRNRYRIMFTASTPLHVLLYCIVLLVTFTVVNADNTKTLRAKNASNPKQSQTQQQKNSTKDARTVSATTSMPPNIVVFLVDDMGWNQVGYHAKPSGNNEIQTPNIDHYATKVGIELDRGYMTPWCGPSRAALITGRTNVYNFNVSSLISTFDDDIGYVAGIQPGTKTLATALKTYGQSIGKPYTAWFNGKFGIGGTAFTNTPLGLGFDEFRGFWGTGLEACDGLATPIGTIGTSYARPFDKEFGPYMLNALPGYFEQHPNFPDVDWCPYIQSVSDEVLTTEEKLIACKTRPRTLPKLLDLDLLDKVVQQISTHNYTKGPMLQYFSTALLHNPISYPKEYDINASDTLPDYFQPGEVKPTPTNDDYRMSINQAIRYLDDIFGSTMQAIKDAGQWNNTIVYYTTDNGGPIYTAAAMNNYPLRGSKFMPFEGGTRVVQFMTGGWLANNLPSDRLYKSSTNIFPNDIAPTLLEMAGADPNLLLDGKKGATYGNSLWKFIRNSVERSTNVTRPKQMVRKVVFSKQFFFDIQANRTLKNFYNGDIPIAIPRLWDPIWPKNGDLLMDSNYRSVKPCRPNGIPSDCCLLDLTNDFQESNPLPADCQAMELEGKNLFEIEGGCGKDANGNYANVICLQPGEVTASVSPSKLSLWSHMGGGGPFTNSKGVPMDGLPMKCVCESIADNLSFDDVTYFNLNAFSPTQCQDSGFFGRRPAQSVPCRGLPVSAKNESKNVLTTSALYDEFSTQGVNTKDIQLLTSFESEQLLLGVLPALYRGLNAVLNRQGNTNWANILRWPFLYQDTCGAKNATSIAFPATTFPPYVFGGKTELTFPGSRGPLELCAMYTPDNKFFCPSHQNPTLQYVESWSYDRLSPQGTFNNGSIWKPFGLFECLVKCPVRPEGTAYIGDGPHGIVV